MDLSTTFLGLQLKNPLVPSASPLTGEIDQLKKLEEAGASAVVLPSLFEEQIRRDRDELIEFTTQGSESSPEALTYFPDVSNAQWGPEEYLEFVAKAKKALSIPVIASLNGASPGGWTDYAGKIQQAGADALELNIYTIPTDPKISGDIVEREAVDIVKSVRARVNIPLAVKCSPYYSNVAHLAHRWVEAGANGLTLFNRFYQPDVDVETMEIRPRPLFSTPQALRLPLTWIGLLYGRVKTDYAATGGVHTGQDVLKTLLVGASVVMMTSVLYRLGVRHVATMERELIEAMTLREFESIRQIKGSMSQANCPNPTAFERAHYMRTLQSIPSV